MNEHTVRYKCVSCGHYEEDDYEFIKCCKKCGNIEDYYRKQFAIEVGYWQSRTITTKKTYGFWKFRFSMNVPVKNRVWVKK
jgi:hypothetical protein